MGSLPETFWGKRHLTLTATDPLTATPKKHLYLLVEQVPEFLRVLAALLVPGFCVI